MNTKLQQVLEFASQDFSFHTVTPITRDDTNFILKVVSDHAIANHEKLDDVGILVNKFGIVKISLGGEVGTKKYAIRFEIRNGSMQTFITTNEKTKESDFEVVGHKPVQRVLDWLYDNLTPIKRGYLRLVS